MNRSALHLLLPISALMLAACSDPAPNEADEELGPATGMPDGTQEPEIPGDGNGDTGGDTAERDAAWEITGREFGPFDPATTYTRDGLESRLPGYQLVESELQSEGQPYPVTMAIPEGGDEPVIVVAAIPGSDLIFAVAVRERGRIANPLGEINQTYGEAGFDGMTCWPGVEERSGSVVCLDPRNAAVGYWLDTGDYQGPDGELPPQDVLSEAVIYEIRWTPPAQ